MTHMALAMADFRVRGALRMRTCMHSSSRKGNNLSHAWQAGRDTLTTPLPSGPAAARLGPAGPRGARLATMLLGACSRRSSS